MREMTAVVVAGLPNISDATKELMYSVMGTSGRVIQRNYNLLGSGRALNAVTSKFMERVADMEAGGRGEEDDLDGVFDDDDHRGGVEEEEEEVGVAANNNNNNNNNAHTPKRPRL